METELDQILAGVEEYTYNPGQHRGADGKWSRLGGSHDAIPEEDWTLGRHLFEPVSGRDRSEWRPAPTLRDKFGGKAKRTKAVQYYGRDGYQEINEALRTGNEGKLEGEAANSAKVLAESMVPTPVDVRAHRLTTVEMLPAKTWEEVKGLVGTEVQDDGFLSLDFRKVENLAHLNDVRPEDMVHLKINVPKGTKAFAVGEDTQFNAEDELILAPGTRLRFNRIYRVKGHPGIQVDMTVVGQK